MQWISEMAMSGIHPMEIGPHILRIPDEDLKEAVAESHRSFTGDDAVIKD